MQWEQNIALRNDFRQKIWNFELLDCATSMFKLVRHIFLHSLTNSLCEIITVMKLDKVEKWRLTWVGLSSLLSIIQVCSLRVLVALGIFFLKAYLTFCVQTQPISWYIKICFTHQFCIYNLVCFRSFSLNKSLFGARYLSIENFD